MPVTVCPSLTLKQWEVTSSPLPLPELLLIQGMGSDQHPDPAGRGEVYSLCVGGGNVAIHQNWKDLIAAWPTLISIWQKC